MHNSDRLQKYACSCLNVRVVAAIIGDVQPVKSTDPAVFTAVYAGEEGLSVVRLPNLDLADAQSV